MFVAKTSNKRIVKSYESNKDGIYHCPTCKEVLVLSDELFPVFIHKRGSKCQRRVKDLSKWHYLFFNMISAIDEQASFYTNKQPLNLDGKIKIDSISLKIKTEGEKDKQNKSINKVHIINCLDETIYESSLINAIQISEVKIHQSLDNKGKAYYWHQMPIGLRNLTIKDNESIYLHVTLTHLVKVEHFGLHNLVCGSGISVNQFLKDHQGKMVKDEYFELFIDEYLFDDENETNDKLYSKHLNKQIPRNIFI